MVLRLTNWTQMFGGFFHSQSLYHIMCGWLLREHTLYGIEMDKLNANVYNPTDEQTLYFLYSKYNV